MDEPSSPLAGDAPVAFIHLPRTGGTSLGEAFIARHGLEGICKVKTQVVDAALAAAIPTGVKAIYGHMNYGLHVHRPVRYATVLRDPVQRVASHYGLFRLRAERSGEPAPSLESFVHNPKWHNISTRMLAGTDSVFDWSEAHLGLAKRHLEGFAYVGFFDRLGALSGALGLGDDLPHANASPQGRALDGEMLKAAERLNAGDLELFDWAQSRFAATSPLGLQGPDHATGPWRPPARPPTALMLLSTAAPGLERALTQAHGARAIPASPTGKMDAAVLAVIDPDTEVLFGDMGHGLHRHCPVRYATVLRDPVERVRISLDWVARQVPAHRLREAVEDFLAAPEERNPLTSRLGGDAAGALETAKTRLEKFAFVGFASEIEHAFAEFRLKSEGPVSRTSPGAWSAVVPRIRELNSLDIELYAWARRRFAKDAVQETAPHG